MILKTLFEPIYYMIFYNIYIYSIYSILFIVFFSSFIESINCFSRYGARETTAYVAAQSNAVYAATYRALSEVFNKFFHRQKYAII